jgi:hypothetical protein
LEYDDDRGKALKRSASWQRDHGSGQGNARHGACSVPGVFAIAARLTALAVELHQEEAAIVPPHLREAPAALPPGVVRLQVARRARA